MTSPIENLFNVFHACLMQVVRPVLFCAEASGTAWGAGTICLLEFQGRIFGITAWHVIANQGADPSHLRIIMEDTGEALMIKRFFRPRFPVDCEDASDLFIFEVDRSLFEISPGVISGVLGWGDNSFPPKNLNKGARLLVAGYPNHDEKYDFDEGGNTKVVTNLLYYQEGYFAGCSCVGEGIYELSGLKSEISFDGMSGSPVFCVHNGAICFIGTVLRATNASGNFHFVGAEFVYSGLLLA